MTTPVSNGISISSKMVVRRLALRSAVAASAVALGGCSMLGGGAVAPHQDKAELARVEETINRARGTGDTASQSEDYARNVDSALSKQPSLAAKIENVKAGRDPSPRSAEPAAAEAKSAETKPAETKSVGAAKVEVKIVDPQAAMVKGGEERKLTWPQMVLAYQAEKAAAQTPVKVQAKREPEPVKSEVAKVEPAKPEIVKAEPAKIEVAKVEPVKTEAATVEPAKIEVGKAEPVKAEIIKPEPVKVSPLTPQGVAVVPVTTEVTVIQPKIDHPAANGNAIAVASIDMSAKGATAMGSMNANGVNLTASDPAADLGNENVSIESIANHLRKQVAANPRQLNLALALQLLAAESKTPDAALAGLSETDLKIVGDVTAAVASIMLQPAGTPANLADRAAPLLEAGKKWEGEGDLHLPRLVLASRVDSYGVFSQVEPKFENGKRHTVIIYCEVANFATRKSDDGWYTTKLAQQDSLITEDGLLVWRPNPEEVEDRSRNQRRDFYLVKKLSLPETLAIGKYTLRMSVTDKQTNKISMVSIPVEIVAR